MNRVANSFIVFMLAFCAAASCPAQTNPQSCPVSYSRLQMPLRHQGGMSTPLVQLSFTNETKKKIDRAKFGLIVIQPDGVPGALRARRLPLAPAPIQGRWSAPSGRWR